jgi:hypothetical protein
LCTTKFIFRVSQKSGRASPNALIGGLQGALSTGKQEAIAEKF